MAKVSITKFWRERIMALIVQQLTHGVTPHKIAITISLGMTLGVFPIMGTTTALCAVAAFSLKLNQPIIQLVNWLVYPLQLALILVFIRAGEWMMHAPIISFSLSQLIEKFRESPGKFFQEFGVCGLHGIIAWFFIAPFLLLITYTALLIPLKRVAELKAAIPNIPNVK